MGTGARQGHVCVSLCACVCARRPDTRLTRHVLFSPFLSLSLARSHPPYPLVPSLSLSLSRVSIFEISLSFFRHVTVSKIDYYLFR